MDYTRKASIQRKTLWQQIADVLREDIIRGKIKPGERIVEEDIAEKFHVSRGPVREALRHIGDDGFNTHCIISAQIAFPEHCPYFI